MILINYQIQKTFVCLITSIHVTLLTALSFCCVPKISKHLLWRTTRKIYWNLRHLDFKDHPSMNRWWNTNFVLSNFKVESVFCLIIEGHSDSGLFLFCVLLFFGMPLGLFAIFSLIYLSVITRSVPFVLVHFLSTGRRGFCRYTYHQFVLWL